MGGPQGQSERVWKISHPTVIRLHDRPIRSESLSTELSRPVYVYIYIYIYEYKVFYLCEY